ncbi:MAG: SpoIIE family protein phosphatase [Rhodospirillales bacterium]|nr:SpoIIE family protein phosphatase [Rhodospirillales bacterium]
MGHGKEAEAAAMAALKYVGNHLDSPMEKLFRDCDLAIRSTRGVAMGMVIVDSTEDCLTFAGAGNIHGLIYGESRWRLTSDSGIIGARFKSLAPETRPFHPGDTVMMFTDGIKSSVSPDKSVSGLSDDLTGMAEQILVDWGLDQDDCGILICHYG